MQSEADKAVRKNRRKKNRQNRTNSSVFFTVSVKAGGELKNNASG